MLLIFPITLHYTIINTKLLFIYLLQSECVGGTLFSALYTEKNINLTRKLFLICN